MIYEFDLIRVDGKLEIDRNKAGMTRETIAQYLSAGILLPEEVRYAEKLLRQLGN